MTEETKVQRPKAKRKLSDISFEKEGAHIAVVSKDQGGSANGHSYALVMKANFSEEFIQKVQQVKVTLELPEFLRKFFGLWYEDSEILATMMGYVKPESNVELYDYEKEYDDYITSKVNSFELIKSLHEAKNLPKAISELTEEQYLIILKDQEFIEQAFKTKSKPAAKDTEPKEVSTSVIKQNSKENIMDENVVELQKALDAQKAELQKALDLIKSFEEDKKQAVIKARKEALVTAVKDTAKADVLFKAVKDASDEDFIAVVKALGELVTLVEKSELFKETGADVTPKDEDKESPVAKVLKAKYSKVAK